MQNTNTKKQTALIYCVSFMIPVIMMAVISVVLKMYPFGERSILISDMSKQFNDYFAYFKTIVTGENNLIYTFSKNLGGDMVGFSAYYLQNPFLLILLLFPNHILPLGVWVMIALQIACCSLTFCIYLNHTNELSRMSIIFSIAYAFMGYIFAYITLPIYFCNIILLPLVMLGIHKILKNEKDWLLYTIMLALSILCNYYIGYMLCIFSAMFFFYLLIARTASFRQLIEYKKHIGSFIIASLLGVMLTAFNLIPVVLSLKGQKDAPSGEAMSFYRNFHMLNVFSKLYSNMYDGNTSNDNLPFIYVGLLAVIFICFYFLSKEIKLREKIVTVSFFAVMLIGFYLHTLDVIWHGFNDPVGFPYRNAFYMSFLLLMIAYRGFIVSCKELKMKECSIFAAIFVLYSIYLFLVNRSAIVFHSIIFDAILLIVIIGVIYGALYRKWTQNVLFLALLVIQIADLSSNAVSSVKQYTDYVSMQDYSEYITRTSPLVSFIQEQDQTLYRTEKNFQRTHNDAMQFNYRGLSHSSSCEKDYVKNFMGRMGFRNFGLWAYYDEGGTAFADCLLGVKYFISQFDATGKPYEMIHQENDKYVFLNPYVFSFGFGVPDEVHSVDMNTQDPFILQNKMAQAVSGQNTEIYREVDLTECKLVNLSEMNQTYVKTDGNEEAYLDYRLNITEDKPVYLYFEAPRQQAAEITVNDFWYGNYFSDTKWDIIEIGSFQEGDTVSVKLYAKGDELELGNTYFYYEDNDALISVAEKVKSEAVNLQCLSDSHLQGTVNIVNSKELLFTIPYEEGWRIQIDGTAVKQSKVFDALITVPVIAGTHTIEMVYVPVGAIPGTILSVVALLICIFIQIYHRKKQNEVQKESKLEDSEKKEPVRELKLI